MSHRPERKEKDCLNCGTIVQGRFCQVCGQENLEPKETFWGMVRHFFEDITHFDGKFFTTLKILITKPGFLPAEYMKGRRVRYLNPIRMYVFTSAVFFLIFFALNEKNKPTVKVRAEPLTLNQRDSAILALRKSYGKDTINPVFKNNLALLRDRTTPVKSTDLLPIGGKIPTGGSYRTREEYDSIQKSLPSDKKDGWLERVFKKRAIALNEKYSNDAFDRGAKDTKNIILHKLPIMMFISLPIFALILKWLYRRRKQFYYADHGIFSIHHYIFSFILLLPMFVFDKLDDFSRWNIWSILSIITFLIWPIYLYISMRRFYQQKRLKTFVKFLLLNLLGLISLAFLFLIFFIFSFFQL